MSDLEETVRATYRQQFHEEPAVVASAPGRVNLIGEHTDYNDGFVLPIAIDRRVAVAMGRGAGGFYSADYGERRPPAGPDNSWADYPRGVLEALDINVPVQATFAGDVPQGAGLSSSAAIEAATALAVTVLLGRPVDRVQLARLCQKAENEYIGVKSGIMDQFASLLSEAGHAMLLDSRTLAYRFVPLDLPAADLTLVVCDTRIERRLAGSGYNDRRARTEEAARALGVPALRDATMEDLSRLSGETLRRARHVVTENARVLQAVAALEADNFATFGQLMTASHLSLRDDYEVSVPTLDLFVETALEWGALGARLTGAGFGGCAIALIPDERVEAMETVVRDAFAARSLAVPVFYRVLPAPGARLLSSESA